MLVDDAEYLVTIGLFVHDGFQEAETVTEGFEGRFDYWTVGGLLCSYNDATEKLLACSRLDSDSSLMELLTNITNSNNGSLPDIDIIIGGILGKSVHQIQPLIPRDLDNSNVRDHVCTWSYYHCVGINQGVQHCTFYFLAGDWGEQVPEIGIV